MVLERVPVTEEAFEAFVQLPGNEDKLFEFIDGEIEEKEIVTGPIAAIITGIILELLSNFVRTRGLGYVTTPDGGYRVRNDRLMPDIGFISKARFNSEAIAGYHAVAPDLAIEVISPTDKPSAVLRKVSRYLEADVPVWLVNPKDKTITVYEPDGEMHTYRNGETLVGSGILEGFTLNLGDVFVV